MNQFISIVAIALVGVAFWYLAGAVADLLTPKLLARIRRKRKGINVNRCPMLECCDRGCVYFDPECLICKFSDRPELLSDEEVSGDV